MPCLNSHTNYRLIFQYLNETFCDGPTIRILQKKVKQQSQKNELLRYEYTYMNARLNKETETGRY